MPADADIGIDILDISYKRKNSLTYCTFRTSGQVGTGCENSIKVHNEPPFL